MVPEGNYELHIHFSRLRLGGTGGAFAPLDFCKVNTSYTPLPPLHFVNSQFAPPSHIF